MEDRTILLAEELPSGYHGRDQEDPAIIMSVRIRSSQMKKIQELGHDLKISKGAIIRRALKLYLGEK